MLKNALCRVTNVQKWGVDVFIILRIDKPHIFTTTELGKLLFSYHENTFFSLFCKVRYKFSSRTGLNLLKNCWF